MDAILGHIALWGLLFALLNLYLILERQLQDPKLPIYSKVVVIVFAGLLVGYAIGIGGFALSEVITSREAGPMG